MAARACSASSPRWPAPTRARATEPTVAMAPAGWTVVGRGASAATADRRDRLPGAMAMDPRPVSVLVVDDHRLMREGTAALLRADERVEVAGLARDGREALALADRRAPDVVLLDLDMPAPGGLEICAALRERHPGMEVLILTVSERDDDLYAALRLGAAGYLLKDMPPRELVQAVLEAGRGEPRIAPRLARRMLTDLGGARSADPLAVLSAREREILGLVAEGLRNREIAERLFLSEATVKTHVRNVLKKLRFRNRAQAAAFAARSLAGGAASNAGPP